MKTAIIVKATIIVEFDENSNEFKNLFENYNKFFSECDYDDFSNIIAKSIARDGIYQSIEGIGRVKINGKAQREQYFPPTPEIDHPVNIIADIDMNGDVDFDSEIDY